MMKRNNRNNEPIRVYAEDSPTITPYYRWVTWIALGCTGVTLLLMVLLIVFG